MRDIAMLLFLIQFVLMLFICGRFNKDNGHTNNKAIVVAEASLCFLVVESIMLYMYLKYILSA